MAKKSKEIMKEQYVFNDYAYAESVRNKTREKYEKINRLLLMSLLLTVLIWVVLIGANPLITALQKFSPGLSSVVSGVVDFASVFLAGCSLVIYALTGALPEVLKIINTCGKIGWYVTPFVFIDMIMYLVGAVLGLAIVLLVPCLAMLFCRSRIKKENEAAEEYIRCFTPSSVVVDGEA